MTKMKTIHTNQKWNKSLMYVCENFEILEEIASIMYTKI